MTVSLFIPCFIDQFFPKTAWNTIKVLEKAGCIVCYNKLQTCCGQAAFNAGFWEESTAVAQKCITDCTTQEVDYVVCPSSSCVAFIKEYYEKLRLEKSIQQKHLTLFPKIYELTDFLVHVLGKEAFGSHFKATATYHDSCSALRACNIKQAPRRLLAQVADLTLVETINSERCCGFGGTFAVKFEAIATAMAAEKVRQIKSNKEVTHIISTDWSCLMHLDGYIKKEQLQLQVMHIADVLAQGI